MQLASGSHIPDGLLAANALLSEKLHQGFTAPKSTLHQGFSVSISSTPLGIIRPLYDEGIRSRCTGKERDAESGNDYFGARYYASSMGRFMSPDWAAKEEPVPYATMDDPQSLNLYSYVRNNPLVRVDADGHCAEDLCIGEGAGAVVVGAAILGTAAFVGVAKYFSTDSGQRSLSTFTSAAGDSIHTNVQKVENAVTGLFSKPAAPGSRPGQDFTKAGKKTIDQTNAANHGGDNKCDKCDKDVRKVASEKGEPTPDDQLQRHHIEPKAAGGSGTPENGQVLCPDCHQAEHAPQPKPTPQPNQ